jgi:hypothetical protein
MKAVDFAVSRILPEDMRQSDYDLSKKGMANIMAQVASRYPDRFGEIAQKLGNLGRNAAWYQGYTTSGADTRPIIDTSRYYAQMDAELDDLRKQKLDKDEFGDQRNEIYMKYSDMIEKDTMKAALSGGNNFARAVASGARGNAAHVKAILSTPGIYSDSKGRTIPLFVRNSFAGGLRPAEVLAGTYGARTAVISTKKSTAKGGDLLKIMTQGTLNYNVTEKDCGVENGIDLPSDDDSLTGRVLAAASGDLPAGTVIDRQALARLRKTGKPVMVRSAMTCNAAHGLCSKCVGVQADGYFPKIGESVGVTASAAIGEPIVQGALNCLVEGTMVRMADRSRKPIEEIAVGDEVMGADTSGKTFVVKVTHTWDQGLQEVNRYTYAIHDTKVEVVCTADHPILQTTEDGRFSKQPAGVNSNTAHAVISEHPDFPTYLRILAPREKIETMGTAHCFDISVDHPDELFVLDNGLIVKNTKHNSGMAKGKKSFSGFNYISQFVQIPDEFKDKAAVSERDGMVENIEDAPQGGKFITVSGERHFALPGFEPTVKVGDKVEAGDQLSDGLVNPSDIVRLRGLGEGRRYYAERLGQILTDSGNPPDKRNVEILARSAVDSYITEDPDEDSPFQPDESVRSSDFSRGYTPPKDTADTHITKAIGSYLQKPALHYTIGTRLTPKMADRLQSAGIESVSASRTEPWFKPEMMRLRTAAHDSKDWLVSMGTSYLSSQMRDALERGDETNVQENYHFGPRLAYGADAGKGAFGEHTATTGKF